MTTEMQCPRRQEVGFRVTDSDQWVEDKCSFCGSISPARLFQAIEAGATLTPTDKDYKVYVAGDGIKHGKAYFQHFTKEDKQRFVDLFNAHKIDVGFPGHVYTLPFFMRLREPDNDT